MEEKGVEKERTNQQTTMAPPTEEETKKTTGAASDSTPDTTSVEDNGAASTDNGAASTDNDDKKEEETEVEKPAKEDDKPHVKPRHADSDVLTQRMQKLALERQKESKGDRLKVIQADASSHLSSAKTFDELKIPKNLLDAIYSMGFDRPSAIQEEALPRILARRNLIGQAQSGSGKTAAFTLGMLSAIKVDEPATLQALCVTPTRELAIQIVDKAVRPMAANMKGLKIVLGISGAKPDPVTRKVDAHMIVGTPGVVVNWLKRKNVNTSTIKVFVLDEADQMVSQDGHRANSLIVKRHMPKTAQSLFFSATFPDEVVEYATKIVSNPDKILIEDGPEFLVRQSWLLAFDTSLQRAFTNSPLFMYQVLDVIKQLWIDTRGYEGGKLEFLADIYSLLTIGQSIVFVRTRREADTVHRTLSEAGYTCSVLHGEVDTWQRDATMEAFRQGESTVLIATNVLARGVDVDNVCLVVNYDVPVDREGNPDFETYLHRIGRTGRFGRKGTAINLIATQRDVEVLAAIEGHFAKHGQEMISKAEADPESLADVIEI